MTASGKTVYHCMFCGFFSCLSKLEHFFMEILLCMVTSILKSGESIHTSHVKIFKGILLSLLMAIARGWLSL